MAGTVSAVDHPVEGVPPERQLVVEDTADALGRLACSFYDDPSARMTCIGVTGTNGKTTTSWLIRGILEEWGHLSGMVGTLEYALAEHRLDASGEVFPLHAQARR